jgi:hypothetical protein
MKSPAVAKDTPTDTKDKDTVASLKDGGSIVAIDTIDAEALAEAVSGLRAAYDKLKSISS